MASKRMKIAYIAGSYTGRTTWDVEQHVRKAEELALEVAQYGVMPLCPHTNTRFFHGQCTEDFWYAGTMALLEVSDVMVFVEGWENSTGAQAESKRARELKIPVIPPGELHLLLDVFRQHEPKHATLPYGEQVKLLRIQTHDALVKLASQVRQDIVVPFCDRFDCSFHRKHDAFWVENHKEEDVYVYDPVTKVVSWANPHGQGNYEVDTFADVMHHLLKLFNALFIEVNDKGDCLAELMEPYGKHITLREERKKE